MRLYFWKQPNKNRGRPQLVRCHVHSRFFYFVKLLNLPALEEKATIKKSLGEVIKQHREECKMTQEFVAEAIGVSRQAVSKWENGTSDPSTSNLIAIAKLFNITPEELLKEVL